MDHHLRHEFQALTRHAFAGDLKVAEELLNRFETLDHRGTCRSGLLALRAVVATRAGKRSGADAAVRRITALSEEDRETAVAVLEQGVRLNRALQPTVESWLPRIRSSASPTTLAPQQNSTQNAPVPAPPQEYFPPTPEESARTQGSIAGVVVHSGAKVGTIVTVPMHGTEPPRQRGVFQCPFCLQQGPPRVSHTLNGGGWVIFFVAIVGGWLPASIASNLLCGVIVTLFSQVLSRASLEVLASVLEPLSLLCFLLIWGLLIGSPWKAEWLRLEIRKCGCCGTRIG